MSDDKARAALYAYATVAFREDGLPPLVHDHVTQMFDHYRDEARADAQAEATYGVVLNYRPDADRVYAWGPFATADAAARFAEFATAEIDPARVIPWPEAQAIPGVRVLDPVAELLTWRTSIALTQGAENERLRAVITRAQNAVDGGDVAAVRAALADTCPRCKGSGIDPEHSSPGCTDPDRGAEPPNLEPCIACQYPLSIPTT